MTWVTEMIQGVGVVIIASLGMVLLHAVIEWLRRSRKTNRGEAE